MSAVSSKAPWSWPVAGQPSSHASATALDYSAAPLGSEVPRWTIWHSCRLPAARSARHRLVSAERRCARSADMRYQQINGLRRELRTPSARRRISRWRRRRSHRSVVWLSASSSGATSAATRSPMRGAGSTNANTESVSRPSSASAPDRQIWASRSTPEREHEAAKHAEHVADDRHRPQPTQSPFHCELPLTSPPPKGWGRRLRARISAFLRVSPRGSRTQRLTPANQQRAPQATPNNGT
jgi:hypothetical protein